VRRSDYSSHNSSYQLGEQETEQNRMVNGSNLFLIYLVLFVFGVEYNELVAWLERQGYDRGYTALLVVGGVLVTLLGVSALIGFEAAAIVLGSFVASGMPMIVGSMQREARKRKEDEDRAYDQAKKLLEKSE
jgi:NADH:ubiquinone oxidoreductase subunit 3 (subunit A)